MMHLPATNRFVFTMAYTPLSILATTEVVEVPTDKEQEDFKQTQYKALGDFVDVSYTH